jgi:hypothetical protein
MQRGLNQAIKENQPLIQKWAHGLISGGGR